MMRKTMVCPLTRSGLKQRFGGPPDMPFVKVKNHDGLDACENYAHHALTIGLVIQGSGRLMCGRGERQMVKGDIFLIESLKMWNLIADGDGVFCILLQIEPDWCVKQANPLNCGRMNFEFRKRVVRSPQKFAALVRAVEAICCDHPYDGEEFGWTVGALMNDNGHFYRLSDDFYPVYQKVRRAREIMLERMEFPLKVSELAEVVELGREMFIRSFQKLVGVSPGLYQHCLRQLEARRLLKDGRSIAEVALATGYSDQSHFHKTFSRFFNMTPRQSSLCTPGLAETDMLKGINPLDYVDCPHDAEAEIPDDFFVEPSEGKLTRPSAVR
ncbi:hypothetical protein C4J81_19085 (plasmid) [Deltaproteobacteria bacterium Smac51]|nr:hypothetical protein C4J81_19085 [Deltaproteobacteria bacterium Smac51]